MIHNYSAADRDDAETDVSVLAYEVLDLAHACGAATHNADPFRQSDNPKVRVWEVAGTPGVWRATIECGYSQGGWHHGPTALDAVTALRSSLPASAVDELAALRRRNERSFERIARAFAILRASCPAGDVGDGVERMVRRMVLRGAQWDVRLHWKCSIEQHNKAVATGHVHASVFCRPYEAPTAWVGSAYGADNMTVAGMLAWSALLTRVGGALNDALAALRGDGEVDDVMNNGDEANVEEESC